MVASPCSSEKPLCALPLRRWSPVWLLVFSIAASACSTVRPADKEFLADPAMTFGSGGTAAAHGEHVLTNREGSFGGGSVSGGGCGCN